MDHSLKIGFSFGLTSGIITTIGLMVGLHSGTHSQLVVIGGILTIAIADSLSDAMGIHVSEESENRHTSREIWEATISTFFFKFAIASTFLIPILVFELDVAVMISVIWGLLVLCLLSYSISKGKKWKVILEHLLVALLVIILAHFIGDWLSTTFFS